MESLTGIQEKFEANRTWGSRVMIGNISKQTNRQKEITIYRCRCRYTGLPTKNETSETIVRNLYCLFPYIHGSLQL